LAAIGVGSGEGKKEGARRIGEDGGRRGGNQKPYTEHHLPTFNSLQQENGTATASEGGGRGGERGNASAALSDMDPKALQRAQLQLLESLCRIDNTPRLCGDAGNLIDSPVMGGRGGGRMSLLATGEEALGTALFQMHLQGASSRRVFDLTGRRENEEDEDEEGEDGEDGEEEEEEKEEREEEEGKTRTSMAIGRNNGGVRFVPAYSPMANSQMSQLSA